MLNCHRLADWLPSMSMQGLAGRESQLHAKIALFLGQGEF
jgi:hypothetical protein